MYIRIQTERERGKNLFVESNHTSTPVHRYRDRVEERNRMVEEGTHEEQGERERKGGRERGREREREGDR